MSRNLRSSELYPELVVAAELARLNRQLISNVLDGADQERSKDQSAIEQERQQIGRWLVELGHSLL